MTKSSARSEFPARKRLGMACTRQLLTVSRVLATQETCSDAWMTISHTEGKEHKLTVQPLSCSPREKPLAFDSIGVQVR